MLNIIIAKTFIVFTYFSEKKGMVALDRMWKSVQQFGRWGQTRRDRRTKSFVCCKKHHPTFK